MAERESYRQKLSRNMLSVSWKMAKDTFLAFISDHVLSRGAAIAFYTVVSIAPVMLIVIAIAGLAFGREAAQNALIGQLGGLMGQQAAALLQTEVVSAAGKPSGILAAALGIVLLVTTAIPTEYHHMLDVDVV